MLTPNDFFDLSNAVHGGAFEGAIYCWEPLKILGDYVRKHLNDPFSEFKAGIHPDAKVHPTAVVNVEQVHIGPGAVVMPHAYVEGPAIISAGATIAQAAYVRADVVLSPGAILGH